MVLEETEKELIEACKRGESDAFRELFERHKDQVYSIALRYSGDPQTAEDIAQETFLKLFARIESFRGESRFDSWLYRLVVNACFDQRRRNRRILPALQTFFDGLRAPDRSVLDEMVRFQMGENVRLAVAALPPEQRMIVVLRYTQGLSYDEIAGVLGCSAGTVASRLSRAHRTLARRVRD